MEKKLRHISKYYWFAIAILTIIYLYRKPHSGDYLYNVRIFSSKISVADPQLQIIELKTNNSPKDENYIVWEVGYKIRTSENGIREVEFKNSWEEDNIYTNFSYYSLSEQKAYAAFVPQEILYELEKNISETKKKEKYFRVCYNIYTDGLIELNVTERGKKGNEDYPVYKESYRAKEIKSADTFFPKIEKRLPAPLDQWTEVINTKYNWDITVEPYENRYLNQISIETFTDDYYTYNKENEDSNFTCNLKSLPQYINIWTDYENGKRAGLEELKFDFIENKKIFDKVYKDKAPDSRSTITINLDRNGRIADSVILSSDNVKAILPLRKKD